VAYLLKDFRDHNLHEEHMLALQETPTDDPEFMKRVDTLIRGSVYWSNPSQVYITKIDHWFGDRWLGFSGKVFGALGVWESESNLTLPPFIPSRVVEQLYLERDNSIGKYVNAGMPRTVLHRKQHSEQNLLRRVSQIAANGAFFWFSGETRNSGRGTLMAYLPTVDTHWPWFVEFKLDKDWRLVKAIGVSSGELAEIEKKAAGGWISTKA
jgi:hypothetical protein